MKGGIGAASGGRTAVSVSFFATSGSTNSSDPRGFGSRGGVGVVQDLHNRGIGGIEGTLMITAAPMSQIIWAMISGGYLGILVLSVLSAVLYIHKTTVQENPSSQSSAHRCLFSFQTTPITFRQISSPNPLTWFPLLNKSFHLLNIPDTFACFAINIMQQQFVPSSS